MTRDELPIVHVVNGDAMEQDAASAAVAVIRAVRRRGPMSRAGTIRLVYDIKGFVGLYESKEVEIARTHTATDWTQSSSMT